MDLQIATNHEKNILDFNIVFHFPYLGKPKKVIFFNFYKGGNNYKKPVKYVLLICPQEILKKIDNKIYFYMGGLFLILKSIKGYFLVDKFKFTSINQKIYNKKAYHFTRKKKQMEERKNEVKINTVSGN
jgi:hypothetical protein